MHVTPALACETNADCGPGTPICGFFGECTQCTDDSHCAAPTPACDFESGTCRQCGGSDTSQCTGSTPACNFDSGECRQCSLSDISQCTGMTPTCNEALGVCEECESVADCGSNPATPACLPDGSCGECTDDSFCSNDEPICDVGTGTCGPCSDDMQCPGEQPYCTDGRCVQCESDADCNNRFCSAAGACVECRDAGDCQHYIPEDPPGSGEPDPCYTAVCHASGMCQQQQSDSMLPQCFGCCISHNEIFFPEFTCFMESKYNCTFYSRPFYAGYDSSQCVQNRPTQGDSFCVCNSDDDCNDGQGCTADSCNPSSPASGAGGCVHTNLNGLACDDGDVCSGPDVCTDGVCMGNSPLSCDDSNPCTNDYCNYPGGCVHQPIAFIPCDDGDACNGQDTCNEAGVCVHANPGGEGSLCDDGDPCTVDDVCTGGLCSGEAPSDCNATAAKTQLSITGSDDDAKDKISFQWLKGTFEFDDLGAPAVGTDYTLCIREGDSVLARLTAPRGEDCGADPCWTLSGNPPSGIAYKDRRKPAVNDGIAGLSAKGTTAPGKGQLKLKAQGVNIPALSMTGGLELPVSAHLLNSEGSCWEASFDGTDVKKNDGVSFKAGHKAP